MTKGLSEEDARKIAAAFMAAMKAEASTASEVKSSVKSILHGAGAIRLADKIAQASPDIWATMWSGIKEFFVEIWEGIVGAAEALFEFLSDLF